MKKHTDLTASEALTALHNKELSATDYISALADKIESENPALNAWAYFDRALALQQAGRLDAAGQTKNLPLCGVAVGLKDIIDTIDMPAENGTILDKGRKPESDAAVAEHLRTAGAVIMGKTVTTELAFMNPSATRNPRNLEHTPGGSSSGSAAAVAAGMVPVALGTQTNGSVIRPASYCGIYALKPTRDLFSTAGVLEEAATFDTVGIFARSLDDLALVAAELAKTSQVQAGRDALAGLNAPLKTETAAFRIAFVKTPVWNEAGQETRKAFETLAENLRGECDEVTLPESFDEVVTLHRTVMRAEIALNFGPYYERGRDSLSAAMREAIEEGRSTSAVDYAAALRKRDGLYDSMTSCMNGYDAIVTPSAAGAAPKGLGSTGNPIFCTLWTYLGMPAINLPFLKTENMPVGIQLVGRRFADGELLQTAHALSQRLKEKGYVSSCD